MIILNLYWYCIRVKYIDPILVLHVYQGKVYGLYNLYWYIRVKYREEQLRLKQEERSLMEEVKKQEEQEKEDVLEALREKVSLFLWIASLSVSICLNA